MKIAILHNQYKLKGGMESYLFDLIKGFIAAGDEIHIYCFKKPKQAPNIDHCKVYRIKIPPLPHRLQKYLFIRFMNKKFDATEYDLSLSLTRTSCQNISICHGIHPAHAKHALLKKHNHNLNDRFETKAEARMLASTSKIVVPSNKIKNEMLEYYAVDEAKIHIIAPPIDTDKFNIELQKERSKNQIIFNIDPNKFSLLFPSIGHKTKGLDILLQAMAQLPEAQYELLIAGNPVNQVVNSNIKFLGYVNQMPPLYSAVDCMILPSRYDAFGLVVAEALQCGTPVIISKHTGAAELISEQDGITLSDLNVATIINAIEKLAANRPTITPHFAERHDLSLNAHIQKIKALL